jgi:hypothetical protein
MPVSSLLRWWRSRRSRIRAGLLADTDCVAGHD